VKNLSSTSWEQRYRQLTLGEVIARLELEDPGRRLADGFANPHSYRGYYDQLAFEPASAVLVDDMLGAARSALGSTYQGWKGGDYMMTADTDCWIAVEGLSAGGWITGVVLDTMLGESVKKRDLRRQLADANQRADELAKAVNDALDSTLTDAARIAELEAELESMRKSWRPIPGRLIPLYQNGVQIGEVPAPSELDQLASLHIDASLVYAAHEERSTAPAEPSGEVRHG
jgi:hypothetical protein